MGPLRGLLGEDVIHQQLQATLALVFVDVQPVDELDVTLGRGETIGLLDVIEGNRIE